MKLPEINRSLLPIKIHYFLTNGAHSGVIPLIPVYALQLGISPDVVGCFYALLSCFTLLSRPLIGALADRLQKARLVLLVLVVMDAAAGIGLDFIPPLAAGNGTSQSLFCRGNVSYLVDAASGNASCLTLCRSNSSACEELSGNATLHNTSRDGFFLTEEEVGFCNGSDSRSCDGECHDGTKDCRKTNTSNPPLQVALLFTFSAVVFVCLGSISSLSDAACFDALGPHPGLFGRQRLWGALGWGVCSLLAGVLNAARSAPSGRYSFSSGFLALAALLAMDVAVLPVLRPRRVRASGSLCRHVGRLMLRPRVLAFVAEVLLVGVSVGFTRSYLFWFLRATGAGQLQLGLVSACMCLAGEIPFFFFAGPLISRIGHLNTFAVSLSSHGILFLSYWRLRDPWLALPLALLQGPCFGSFYAAMTSYAKKVAPEGAEATVQGVASGAFEGLGVATGSLLGGFGIRALGERDAFLCAGVTAFVCGIVAFALNCGLERDDTGKNRSAPPPDN